MQSCPKCRSACTPDSNRCPSCGARIQRDLDAPRAPTVGAYRLGTLLLECTAGKTYQAEDTRRPERALVKILRHEHGLDEQALARYFAQVRAVNALKHPHIAR